MRSNDPVAGIEATLEAQCHRARKRRAEVVQEIRDIIEEQDRRSAHDSAMRLVENVRERELRLELARLDGDAEDLPW